MLMPPISCTHSAGNTKYSSCSIKKDEEENAQMLLMVITDQSSLVEKLEKQLSSVCDRNSSSNRLEYASFLLIKLCTPKKKTEVKKRCGCHVQLKIHSVLF